MKQKLFRSGGIIPNLTHDGKAVNYEVVNEREVRAVAGLMLAVGLITYYFVKVQGSYLALQITVGIFFAEFLLKTVIGPHASIVGFLARPIIKKQEPDYVGGIQKKFAWGLGLVMAFSIIIITWVFQLTGIAPMAICGICLTLMWIESAFGICVGCKIYWGLIKIGWMKEPKVRPKCNGNSCTL